MAIENTSPIEDLSKSVEENSDTKSTTLPNFDVEALKHFQKSPFAFIEASLGEVPQPIKPEYKEYVLALYTIPAHQFSDYVNTIHAEMFEPFEKGKHLTWQQAVAIIAVQRAVNGSLPPRIAIKAGRGTGKAIDKNEIVWLNNKNNTIPVKAKDVKVGDTILGKNKPTKVIAIANQPRMKMYKVTLDDGSALVVNGAHLFTVSDGQIRKKLNKRVGYDKNSEEGKWETIDVNEMIVRGTRLWNKNPERRFRLPIQSVKGSKKVADAYTVGVWYGDGTRNTSHYTKPDDFIAYKIGTNGYSVSTPQNDRGRRNVKLLKKRLNELDVPVATKEHLPPNFLTWDFESRVELLRGLMDTDGYCDTRGNAEFSTSIPSLADDVALLIRSLGGKTSIRVKEKTFYKDKDGNRVYCKPSYRLSVSTTFNPFSLPRKAERYKTPTQDRYLYRFIDSIEYLRDDESVCFEVDAEDNLFLAGEGMIATHNSSLMSRLILWFLFSFPLSKIPCTAPTADQLFAVLWSEINLVLSMMKPEFAEMFEWETKFVRVKEHSQVWYARAKTASKGETGALSGVHCFKEGTVEVLTKDGFKAFKNLTVEDLVLTKVGWRKPTEVIRKMYKGEMVEQNSRLFSFSVTPQHKFPTIIRNGHYKKNGIDEWGKEQLLTVSDWRNHQVKVPRYIENDYGQEKELYTIPAYKNHYISQPKRDSFEVPMDPWVAFLGWYLSEGSCGQNNVSIAQSLTNRSKRDEIANTISELGFTPSVGNKDVVLCNVQVSDHVKKLCPGKALTKRVPEFIFNLSQRQIRIFLDAYRKGDGCVERNNGRVSYVTASKEMASDLQRLILLAGGYASIFVTARKGTTMSVGERSGTRNSDVYVVREWAQSRNKHAKSSGKQRVVKQYTGLVECITVPSSVFYVRDKKTSHSFWTGNSDYMASFADESYDIEDEVFQVAEATQTGDKSLMVLVGNAVHDHGYFYDCFNKNADGWIRITMNAEESPIVNQSLIESQRKMYGVKSNHYRASILGEFPIASAIDVDGWYRLFSDDWINEVMVSDEDDKYQQLFEDNAFRRQESFLGVDPSGEGTDEAVGYIRNMAAAKLVFHNEHSSIRGTALSVIGTIETYAMNGQYDVVCDNFGVGAELSQEVMIQSNSQYVIDGRNVGDKPEDILDQSVYLNERARMYDALYWWGKRGGKILYDDVLAEELKTIFIRKSETGKKQIMPKREMRKRGYRSPNRCDALAQTTLNDRMLSNYIPRAEFKAVTTPAPQRDRHDPKPKEVFDKFSSIPSLD